MAFHHCVWSLLLKSSFWQSVPSLAGQSGHHSLSRNCLFDGLSQACGKFAVCGWSAQSHQLHKGSDEVCFACSVVKHVWLGSLQAHMGVPLGCFGCCVELHQHIDWLVQSVHSNTLGDHHVLQSWDLVRRHLGLLLQHQPVLDCHLVPGQPGGFQLQMVRDHDCQSCGSQNGLQIDVEGSNCNLNVDINISMMSLRVSANAFNSLFEVVIAHDSFAVDMEFTTFQE